MSQSVISISQVGYWSGKQLNLESENADRAIYRVMYIGGNTDHQDNRIQYRKTTSGTSIATAWYDNGGGPPAYLSSDNVTFGSSTGTNAQYVYLKNGSDVGVFTNPFYVASGPTVTSHYWVDLTSNAVVKTSDTIQYSDFTFLKGYNSFSPSPFAPVALSDGSGYVYDYQETTTDFYTATIDSQSVTHFFYDSSWTSTPQSYNGRTANSTRILNVLGTIPNTANFNISNNTWTNTARQFGNNSRNMYFNLNKISAPSSPTTKIFVVFYVYGNQNDIKAKFVGLTYEGSVLTGKQSGTELEVGAQQTMSHTFTTDGTDTIVSVADWIYSAEPEGDGYVAPVSTTSNGGGKPNRYPLIMTNLFNRNRSLYSIGMTHKDTWDLFL